MIHVTINGIRLRLETNEELFSPDGADRGTLAMLSFVDFSKYEKVLDLGCGYGIVGIAAAKAIGCGRVFMSDIDAEAVRLSRLNAELNGVGGVTVIQSDGFQSINETGFGIILSNPPYHADFKVPKGFIEKGFNRLIIGGQMVMVTKRMDWYRNKLTAIFGGVQVFERDGYFVFTALKKRARYANTV